MTSSSCSNRSEWGILPPVFSIGRTEVVGAKNKWVRLRQGTHSIEVLSWDVAVDQGMKGDCLVEFHGKTRILRGFAPTKSMISRDV